MIYGVTCCNLMTGQWTWFHSCLFHHRAFSWQYLCVPGQEAVVFDHASEEVSPPKLFTFYNPLDLSTVGYFKQLIKYEVLCYVPLCQPNDMFCYIELLLIPSLHSRSCGTCIKSPFENIFLHAIKMVKQFYKFWVVHSYCTCLTFSRFITFLVASKQYFCHRSLPFLVLFDLRLSQHFW